MLLFVRLTFVIPPFVMPLNPFTIIAPQYKEIHSQTSHFFEGIYKFFIHFFLMQRGIDRPEFSTLLFIMKLLIAMQADAEKSLHQLNAVKGKQGIHIRMPRDCLCQKWRKN